MCTRCRFQFCRYTALRSHEAFSRNIFRGLVVFFAVKCGLSLSHNSTKCLLFILKFSFHSSTLVLLFRMFVHQMFVLPGRHHIRCFFGDRLLRIFKCHFNRFFDSLNAWTAILSLFFKIYLLLLLLISSSKPRLPAEKPSFQRTEIIS